MPCTEMKHRADKAVAAVGVVFAGRIRGHGHLVMGAEAILASALGAATFDQLKYTEKTNGESTPPAITSFSAACSGASSVRK